MARITIPKAGVYEQITSVYCHILIKGRIKHNNINMVITFIFN